MKPFISVTQGLSGWFAVLYTWNDEFYEPEQTGVGRYATREEAAEEAEFWAGEEELELRV